MIKKLKMLGKRDRRAELGTLAVWVGAMFLIFLIMFFYILAVLAIAGKKKISGVSRDIAKETVLPEDDLSSAKVLPGFLDSEVMYGGSRVSLREMLIEWAKHENDEDKTTFSKIKSKIKNQVRPLFQEISDDEDCHVFVAEYGVKEKREEMKLESADLAKNIENFAFISTHTIKHTYFPKEEDSSGLKRLEELILLNAATDFVIPVPDEDKKIHGKFYIGRC